MVGVNIEDKNDLMRVARPISNRIIVRILDGDVVVEQEVDMNKIVKMFEEVNERPDKSNS